MSLKKQVLLLVGSARQPKSTSESLGNYLVGQLKNSEFEIRKIYLYKTIKSEKSINELLDLVNHSHLIIFAFPLYVDSLPFSVIKSMELINTFREEKGIGRGQKMMCIINSGFPEAHQNDIAISICRKFAAETGFHWLGGLALGGGGVISGKPLEKVGWVARNVMRALNIASEAVSSGKSIPREAVNLMAKPMIPKWIYNLIADLGWKGSAKKYGTQKNLKDKPYKREEV